MASKAGLQTVQEAHPDITIHVAVIDEVLNDHGYIVPGCGDAGDRYASPLLPLQLLTMTVHECRLFKTFD